MRCSGGSKCNCALFQGGHRAKRCKSCHHDRGSHYEPGSDDDDDDDDDDDESSGNDRDDKDGDDNDNGNAKQPSIRMKNKMTVSSLVANLINDGERSRVEVENAEREAKAGLTRRQYGSKQKANKTLTPKPRIKTPLPPVTSSAKVLKIVVFSHGKESLTATPLVKFPALVDTAVLEEQGLVAHTPEGFSFCKKWDSKTMSSFFEQHLPRPFQYFKEQEFSGLPFCVLKREGRAYVVVKPPVGGPTGKFYQDNAMGPPGGSYKNRKIILISKRPIPQDILDGWNQYPISTEKGPGDVDSNAEDDQPVRGSSKMRPKPKKKVQAKPEDNLPSDHGPGDTKNLKRVRHIIESEDSDTPPRLVGQSKGKGRERGVERKPIQQETIVISDNDSGTSQNSNNGSETEREPPSPRAAKRRRVYVPGHEGKDKGVDLAASVSSLRLEEASSSAGPSTSTSATILDAWSTMRKASAPFVVGNGEASFEL